MASCEIQIVNPSVLSRIESYLNDTAYREAIENSANYNTRLCLERRLRLPFLDSQTGIAQNHSNLFMSGRERIPGMTDGQVYTYPSKRWRKKRRQYLMQPQVQLRRCDLPGTGGASSGGVGVGSASSAGTAVGSGVGPGTGGDSSSGGDLHSISTVENPAVAASTDDSKDSNSTGLKDDPSGKSSDAWFYEELELQGMDGYDDVDPDSDYDYEETYSKRRKKRGGGAKPGPRASGASVPAVADSPHPKKGPKGTGQGRGRKKGVNYAEMTDSEKPFSCDLCGARYKTRPGLTYHYTHSHKERSTGGGGGSGSGSGSSATAATAGSGVSQSAGSTTATVSNPVAVAAGMGPPVVGAAPAAGSMVSADEEPPSDIPPMSPPHHHNPHQDNPAPGWTKFQDSYLTFLNAPG